ncbi:MAG: 4-(cytidine 5'-diphospho)-2-C-methyl-D-erythritol kinase [Cyanobacteria bacterium J083]|nr:MAG: 4-(cytidine 5'-diphospho)-2-C-methyl-D-erythritol kinase [Cyanobacteria bacterium J083]
MQSYSLLAPAKINLYLEILGDRPDGFHELVMIMQGIELADRLEISANSTDLIRIFCQTPGVPTDEKNLAYKAAQLMKSKFPQVAANYGGVDIKIEKTIPVAAGLAGGSTDSAAVLVGLDLMWKLGLTQPELQELGALLGSDVPFCLIGGTAIATGRGEILDPIQDLDDLWVVLAKYRNLSISTAWAYQTYRQNFQSSYISEQAKVKDRTARVRSGNLVKAIAQKDPEAIGKYLYNDLEKVVLPIYEPVANLKKAFAQTDILGTLMSGSGPTVFALCATKAQAEASREATAKIMADPNLDFWVTKLSSTGIQIGG